MASKSRNTPFLDRTLAGAVWQVAYGPDLLLDRPAV
jgi:hypothetical protein